MFDQLIVQCTLADLECRRRAAYRTLELRRSVSQASGRTPFLQRLLAAFSVTLSLPEGRTDDFPAFYLFD